MRRLAVALAAAVVLLGGPPAAAHRVAPEEVMGQITEPASRARLGVVGAERDPRLPRLLIVRVGERWLTLDAALRRETAETWRERWRHVVAGGVVAVTDAEGRSLVSFDAAGRAQLREP
ncbi:MAG TPA: hypothetical protein VHQ66_03015 [Myxococcota bacterium]|nr:hypothetical protein [Myxococcota bacterium]